MCVQSSWEKGAFIPVGRRDIINALEQGGLSTALWSLIAAMQHYFRYNEEYTGQDPEERDEVNCRIQRNREDAFYNLHRFARLTEKHCSPKALTAQLHTLVCRISDQEKMQGSTASLGELFMERAVRLLCL